MPRRNRQKLHRQLRLAAEARNAEARRARLCLRAEREREDQMVCAVLGGRTRTATVLASPVDPTLASMRELLRLAGASGTWPRVEKLVRVIAEQVPPVARCEWLPWFVLLARHHWWRRPEAFRAPRGSVHRKRDAFVVYLLARFPVPPFLLRALDVDPVAVARVPVEDEWAVGLLAHVGAGRSLREAVGTEICPAPLTRRMRHLFLSATARTTPIEALRCAQVVGLGGPPDLASRLRGTRLGVLRGSDAALGEPFWQDVLGWLCRQQGLPLAPAATLERLFAWIEARRREAVREGTAFSLKGRTAASATRDAEAWHATQAAREHPDFPASGLLPHAPAPWSIREIRTAQALRTESEAMHHCAWEYRRLLRRRKVALWSLRRDGERQVTIEVALAAARVVQAKRACNAPCGKEELAVVREWAAVNRLAVSATL